MKKKILNAFHSYSFADVIQTIEGVLFIIYIPLLIGLIWLDTIFMLKLIATNSVLMGAAILIERVFGRRNNRR